MYELVIEKQAKKYLLSLDQPLRLQIAEDVYSLSARFMDGKRLGPPLEKCRSFRSGNYRIIYQVDIKKHLIRVVKIGDRKDVYRK